MPAAAPFSVFALRCRFSFTYSPPKQPLLVAVLLNPLGVGDLTRYTVVIDWGDGSQPSSGSLTAFSLIAANVQGAHVYPTAKFYWAQVTVSDSIGRSAPTISSLITVVDR